MDKGHPVHRRRIVSSVNSLLMSAHVKDFHWILGSGSARQPFPFNILFLPHPSARISTPVFSVRTALLCAFNAFQLRLRELDVLINVTCIRSFYGRLQHIRGVYKQFCKVFNRNSTKRSLAVGASDPTPGAAMGIAWKSEDMHVKSTQLVHGNERVTPSVENISVRLSAWTP